MNFLAFHRVCVACAVVLCFGGCGGGGGLTGPTGTVSGTVSIKGKPLSEGTITFFGENNGDTATSTLEKDGTYALKYGTSFSLPAGDYRVAVIAGPPANSQPVDPQSLMKTVKMGIPPKNAVPDKYKDPKTSQLIAVVKAGSNTDVNFDLK